MHRLLKCLLQVSRDYFVKAGLLARRLPHLPPVRPRPRVAHVSAEADCANLHVRRRVWIAHLLQDPHGQLEGCFRWRHLCTPFLTSSASREGSSVTRTRFQPGSPDVAPLLRTGRVRVTCASISVIPLLTVSYGNCRDRHVGVRIRKPDKPSYVNIA